jgi:hypothetical protein
LPVTDYTPDLADVGAVAATRTKDKYGNVTGTFSPNTTPTDTIVENLIQDALDKVSIRIGDDIPSGLFEDAKDVVALRTAMLIESTYFPEQMQNARSPYQVLKAQFDEDIQSLLNSIFSVSTGGSLNDPPTPNAPRGAFPPATPWLTRPM